MFASGVLLPLIGGVLLRTTEGVEKTAAFHLLEWLTWIGTPQ